MGARTGEQFIQRLSENPAEIWLRGERVADPTRHPGLERGIRSLAALYDRQWSEPDKMLFDPGDGERVARSHFINEDKSDLPLLGEALSCAAQFSFGMMGREPSYLNRVVSAFAGSADFFGQRNPEFGKNARSYHRYVRDNDLALTHTLLNPRPKRAVGEAQQDVPEMAAHVVKERDDGIVIRGARLLATLPIADEIAVFPARMIDTSQESARFAFGVAIPTSSPGLKFLCRDSFDYGFSHHDHPLSSRFEEMDAAVFFDDVFVPWERVLCYRDPEICNSAYLTTGANAHMAYQVLCKNIVKTEFLLGLASMMVESADIGAFQHIHEKISEIWVNLEVLKALKVAAEAGAEQNAFGLLLPAWDCVDAARNLYPRLYPRMIEIIQQIGASGLVAMPTQADLEGPLSEEIGFYYQSARLDAHDRVPLYRLAWDTALSAFGTRQVLYERYFFGDPVQMAGAVFRSKDRSASMEKVRAFLRQNETRH